MTTAAPLPGWRDLLGLFAEAPTDDALAQPWRSGNEAAFWFSRGAWAMQAVVLWWRQRHTDRQPTFWLPDYFCNQSTAPLRQGGAHLIFYPIGADLAPDWAACGELAKTAPPDLFVLVHYFGKAADGARARQFCQPFDALLIEDAAHALGPGDGIGEHGDFVFYSPHKVFAAPDGALLLIRDGIDNDGVAAMKSVVAALGGGAPAPWTWLVKRLIQKVMPERLLAARTRRQGPAFVDDPPYAPMPPTTEPSTLARRLLARQVGRRDTIAEKRHDHAQALIHALAQVLAERPGCRIPACRILCGANERAPYRLVLRCDDAPGLFAALRGRGCPVESWPDLPPEVLADPAAHSEALALRREVLLLPVHQTADVRSLISYCA